MKIKNSNKMLDNLVKFLESHEDPILVDNLKRLARRIFWGLVAVLFPSLLFCRGLGYYFFLLCVGICGFDRFTRLFFRTFHPYPLVNACFRRHFLWEKEEWRWRCKREVKGFVSLLFVCLCVFKLFFWYFFVSFFF